ncbi:hypothetical protein BJL95_03595 [Methylomonas sp. LWB]|nr:hypothetical protein BJL95_03595 [Methylomonas sp. LWB]
MMNRLLLTLLAVALIVEEWLWDFLSACGHYLALALGLERIERWLSRCSPGVALIAITVPILLVTPLNLAALWLLLHGLLLQGLVLEIVAKLLGTLLVARVFTLTKPQLLSFAVLAWLYGTITGWLRWAHAKIAETALYRWSRLAKQRVKDRVKTWLKR